MQEAAAAVKRQANMVRGGVEQPKLFAPASSRRPATLKRGEPEGERSEARVEDFQAVSPLANMGLREVCAFCNGEIGPPGFVILDYEELGAFCNQECADRRFRLYLYETADEDESASA
jgi:hypothetical protein